MANGNSARGRTIKAEPVRVFGQAVLTGLAAAGSLWRAPDVGGYPHRSTRDGLNASQQTIGQSLKMVLRRHDQGER